jgi:carbonic anhydrase/acetyltransferase-like protein (isoleucine patch superfamily)
MNSGITQDLEAMCRHTSNQKTPKPPHKQDFMNAHSLIKFLIPEKTPSVSPLAFIAQGAIVVGDVTLHDDSSLWYGAVLRGDINSISVGARSNIQDGAVVHVSDDHAAIIGDDVTVGHRAIVHACRVENEVLVGMGAILLDGCHIGPRCIIAAGAVVPKGMIVPEGSLVVGTPGRVVRTLRADERLANRRLAAKYVEISRRYRAAGYHSEPLAPVPSTRQN